jgi:WD40 repeat protein
MYSIEVSKIATYTGHRDCIYTIIAHPNPAQFFTASGDGMVVLWNLEKPDEGEVFAQVPNSVYALHLNQSNNSLLIGENFMGIHQIDLIDKKQTKSLKITDSAIFDIKTNGRHIFVACGNGDVIILHQETYVIICTIKASNQSARCLEITDQHLIVGYSDHHIRIFDLDKFELKQTLSEHTNSIFTLTIHQNQLLSAGRDAHLKIWDINHNQLSKDIIAHMFAINHICFSPDGKLFATCSMDKSIKVWDSSNFELLKVIDKSRHAGHGTSINKLMWTTFNNYLISVSDDRNISIWKLDIKIKNIK